MTVPSNTCIAIAILCHMNTFGNHARAFNNMSNLPFLHNVVSSYNFISFMQVHICVIICKLTIIITSYYKYYPCSATDNHLKQAPCSFNL